ncbi:MAG TPA: uracil-DNA glycosylase [Clostridia bacterium]|jgi:uracil-DNA glycosylase|nr:uracil-DNA glycosylase [Clostridia bacterium]
MLTNDWAEILKTEFHKPYMKNLCKFLEEEYKNRTIFPPFKDIFNALNYTPYKAVKVLILGQDPYPNYGQAHGLSFSVNPGVEIPKSLQNIFKELHDDLGCAIPQTGYLKKWADQGVLLLNSVLTVRAGEPNSHKGKGWEIFTDQIIRELNKKEQPVVFILWGNNARAKKSLITENRHLILESVHPSPLSAKRGFFGSKPFSKTNDFLIKHGLEPIDWQI